MYDFILFDLDGTLIDSREGIFLSLEYALSLYGIKYNGDMTEFIGPSFVTSFPRLLKTDKETTKKLSDAYRTIYAKEGVYKCSLYRGIRELLEQLKANGKKIALATAKPLVYAKTILSHKRISRLFDFIGGSNPDNGITEKEQVLASLLNHIPSPRKTVLVGDTIYDCLGAKAVNIDCVGVTYGFGKEDDLIKNATFVAHSVKELKKILLQ